MLRLQVQQNWLWIGIVALLLPSVSGRECIRRSTEVAGRQLGVKAVLSLRFARAVQQSVVVPIGSVQIRRFSVWRFAAECVQIQCTTGQ